MNTSATLDIPNTGVLPKHIAVIMDGNGRWATSRHLPRTAGHLKGIASVRKIVRHCGERGIKYLTLFSFSSENWRRPADEVGMLMHLFTRSLKREVKKLHQNKIRLHVVGDLTAFDANIQTLIRDAELLTQDNDNLHLTIAANYGGRWDLLQAMQQYLRHKAMRADSLAELQQASMQPIAEEDFSKYLSMAWAPEPDIFIRTGGEQRISNFLIWQLAYTELYFTDVYWPDFGAKHLDQALLWYAGRERRFGQTSAQIKASQS